MYIGFCETSVYPLMQIASMDGRGSNQSRLVGSVISYTLSSVDCAEQRVSSETYDVCGCEPASALTRTRSGALWRAPHLLRISEWLHVLVDGMRCGG